MAKYTNEECSCGRGLPVIKSLEGRTSDIIVTTDGKLITPTNFLDIWYYRIRPYIPNVNYAQVIQKSKDRLIVEMVKGQHYSNRETSIIVHVLKEVLGEHVDIEFRDLDSIPTQVKRRFVQSEMDISLI